VCEYIPASRLASGTGIPSISKCAFISSLAKRKFALLIYIFCIAERHNAAFVFLIEGDFLVAEVSVSQPSLGIRFPTDRKHVVIVDKVVAGIQLFFKRANLLNPNGALSKVKDTSTGLGK
jgi:hypothetical protein